MKIPAVIGIVLGVAILVAGLVTHLIALAIGGVFVAGVSIARFMRDRRNDANHGYGS